jgi:hypothetical protein
MVCWVCVILQNVSGTTTFDRVVLRAYRRVRRQLACCFAHCQHLILLQLPAAPRQPPIARLLLLPARLLLVPTQHAAGYAVPAVCGVLCVNRLYVCSIKM